jgi:hypothetical protein
VRSELGYVHDPTVAECKTWAIGREQLDGAQWKMRKTMLARLHSAK